MRLLTSVPGHQKSPLLTVHFALLNLPIRLLSWAEPLQTAGQQLLLESPFFHVLDTIVVLAVLGAGKISSLQHHCMVVVCLWG